jgi:hypothetical protein
MPQNTDPVPPIFLVTVPITEGLAQVIPDAPMAPGGNCESESGCQRLSAVICEDRGFQLRHHEQDRVLMREYRISF